MQFIQISKINSHGEKGLALVRVDDIVGINQKHIEPTKLYDENGNLVSETPSTDKDFQILVSNGKGNEIKYHVDESEFNRLVSLLTA